MNCSETLKKILHDLIQLPSMSPDDAGCQDYLSHYLSELGFQCTRFDCPPASNLYAQYGSGDPLLIFAGHTDVVPVGEHAAWHTPPFELVEKDGFFFGRGVADMKGSLAAMMVMAKAYVEQQPEISLGFLITSGEEGDDFDKGTPYVMQQLQAQGIKPTYCIVGEPSSEKQTGDVIKVGRRGSLSAKITVRGKQGHVAYPHLADNPIHKASHAIALLADLQLDKGNAYFPPSSLQITQIQAGGTAGNIIPEQLTLSLNIRYSTEQTAEGLKSAVGDCFQAQGLNPEITWRLNGEPFLTQQGKLLEATRTAIQDITGVNPSCSTSGGTSDGRFIAPYGVEVLELGPCNASIHQVNESVSARDLEVLSAIYLKIAQLLASRHSQLFMD